MINRPRSFRRVLMLRILLLSIPILLIGQAMTLRKARTSLLDTARQNLSSSAARKADELVSGVQAVETNLQLLAQTEPLKQGDPAAARAAVEQLTAAATPYQIQCVELRAAQPDETSVRTCDRGLALETEKLPWSSPDPTEAPPDFAIFSPGADAQLLQNQQFESDRREALIHFTVASPVYNEAGDLRYHLIAQVSLAQREDTDPRSLVGNTVVIDSDGFIITHPDQNQVGQKIFQVRDVERLESVIGSVRAGNSKTVHLFRFLPEQGEWLAGYAGANIPIRPDRQSTWTVLAVTPLNQALYGLKDIRDVLILLTLGLLSANALLAIYIARGLSLPIERLIRYAQAVDDTSEVKPAPRSHEIWELDYLGDMIEQMLERLKTNLVQLRQAWQDAKLASQLKNEFLANTSHELRTPLNAIIGSIQIVRDGYCDSHDEEMEFLEKADSAARHLLEIIRDILDVGKIEAGTVHLHFELIDLRRLLQDVLDMQTLQIQQKGLNLVRPELPEPIMVKVDRSRFRQVLLNVVNNAIKFTDQGSISVLVESTAAAATSTDPEAADGLTLLTLPQVKIIIRDTGIGIAPEQQHKLFQPFVMVDGSYTRAYEGTGLGLAISRNLMQLMQGDIELWSEGVGQGTTVIIRLPIRTADAHRLEPESPSGASESQALIGSSEL
ncbi:two-component sensor histidine kinase [Romeria aff. gracilis LEGE 07310]|uniref:Circadian input-output histidine kinase CikA n=1 Tax=Vasconcelosia minhoensis LEGE 07310 TaxID=915328 RepID=A0A8J7DQK2_9CYAN|nr:ATP-binding protein [Romeria gracilis]MBE9076699.1 two-component sensor histidine kinase [Romeria aff. gracilis LEGE 07310]